MARVTPPPGRATGVRARMVSWFTERALGRPAGRPAHPDRLAEPLRAYAHLPGVLRGYAKLEQATAGTHRLDRRHQALAERTAATLTQCAYCIDLGPEVVRRWGVTDEELLALPHYDTSPLFDEVDKLVLTYAEGMSRTQVDVPADVVQRLREHFTDAQIVELTHRVALENVRGRFNLALGIEAAGFSQGRVCALPAPPPGAAPHRSDDALTGLPRERRS
ncbi:carboxymuconolactone decarboxylase family protein [Dactylosporangium sp. McL0621]|uniref:carboxymuconolactone decarboxylase family protein n=1 Tax=Dactylosporangium sp. McL0621 TaxID=3415678 RepID=UPI003CF96047